MVGVSDLLGVLHRRRQCREEFDVAKQWGVSESRLSVPLFARHLSTLHRYLRESYNFVSEEML